MNETRKKHSLSSVKNAWKDRLDNTRQLDRLWLSNTIKTIDYLPETSIIPGPQLAMGLVFSFIISLSSALIGKVFISSLLNNDLISIGSLNSYVLNFL